MLSRTGLGVMRGGARLGIGLIMSCANVSYAQSSASFPDVEPAPSTPPAPPPAPVPPTPVQPSAPVPTAPPATEPQPAPSGTQPAPPHHRSPSDTRYPTLPRHEPQAPALVAPSMLYPPILPYEEGQPIPPGYSVEYRPASGLILGGALTLLASYAVAIGLGAAQDFENGASWLAVPVVGPWAAIGARGFSCKQDTIEGRRVPSPACVEDAFDEVTYIAAVTADGLVQATGAALFFAGLASGRHELVRHEASDLEVVPELSHGRLGLRVRGEF